MNNEDNSSANDKKQQFLDKLLLLLTNYFGNEVSLAKFEQAKELLKSVFFDHDRIDLGSTPVDAYQQKLDDLLWLIFEHFNKKASLAKLEQLSESVELIISQQVRFDQWTEKVEDFLTFGQIEYLFVELNRQLGDVALKALIDDMRHFAGEKGIIAKKKMSITLKE